MEVISDARSSGDSRLPKRFVDGEGLWRSRKLSTVTPIWCRSEYANLLPLAEANGSFECDPFMIWCQVYSFNRPDIKHADVEVILSAFETAGLLFRWFDNHKGTPCGYFVGINKPGRLPSVSQRTRRDFKLGPIPPQDELNQYLEAYHKRTTNSPQADHSQRIGLVTVRFGKLKDTATAPAAAEEFIFSGNVLKITPDQHRRLVDVYQDLNVAAHYTDADLYLETHVEKKYKNHFAFMRNWLSRERGKTTKENQCQPPKVGRGPDPQSCGVRVNPEALERIRRREEEREQKRRSEGS